MVQTLLQKSHSYFSCKEAADEVEVSGCCKLTPPGTAVTGGRRRPSGRGISVPFAKVDSRAPLVGSTSVGNDKRGLACFESPSVNRNAGETVLAIMPA
ncbi:hypothetical protein TYRP_012279 [Tyrophagus putrescentiae]|nr:hypothetical protein TYRP_012279 [Tyrophagus putrescentiae]